MTLLNVNFDPADLPDWSPQSLATLYEQTRRDAIFAYAEQRGEVIYLLRDHLGTVPLFWRFDGEGVRVATNLAALAQSGDRLNKAGVAAYLAFGSAKIVPLFEEIKVVPPGTAVVINTQTRQTQTLFQHQFNPVNIPKTTTQKELVIECEHLLKQAIKRQLKTDQVGLLLSGGIDSGLLGIHLRQLGVEVTAYTAALWGMRSSELPYAKINVETVGAQAHHVAYLEGSHYERAFEALPHFFKGPFGSAAGLGIYHLWRETPIGQEQQLFFGQNSDTMTCSVGQQSNAFFLSQLPQGMRRLLGKSGVPMMRYLQAKTAVGNYLSLVSNGLIADESFLPFGEWWNGRSLHDITLAGMLICHTPSDGELIAQPAINSNQPVSNPYYDVDLIQFCMGIPLHLRLGLSDESKIKIGIKKRFFQQMAAHYLPQQLVNRKKGFSVSLQRDQQTNQLAQTLPTHFHPFQLQNMEQRFAAAMLQMFCRQHQLHDEQRGMA